MNNQNDNSNAPQSQLGASGNVLKSRRYFNIVLCAIIAAALFFGMHSRKRYYANEGVVWTTQYHITYEAKRDFNDSIQRLFAAIDGSVSPFNKQSRISAINRHETSEADTYFTKLYTISRQVNKQSGGMYDPTVMPLVNAWGFGYTHGALPTQRQIDSILAYVGIAKTSMQAGRVITPSRGFQFDFSSIAKGMACDEIGNMLARNGASSYMVEIGGEIAARGVNSNGGKWTISVDLPIENDSVVVHENAMLLALDSGGVATSGNYRNYKVVDGRKVAHIINPLTGKPQLSNLLSATVIAPTCALADAWSTACMAMGLERSKRVMEGNTQLGVLLISVDDAGRYVFWSNKKFASYVIPTSKE